MTLRLLPTVPVTVVFVVFWKFITLEKLESLGDWGAAGARERRREDLLLKTLSIRERKTKNQRTYSMRRPQQRQTSCAVLLSPIYPIEQRNMAGTRLLINLIAVGQLLVLLGSSLYFGLCYHGHDFVCIPLFHQGGRSLLQQESKRMNELEQLNNNDWGTIETVVIGLALEDDRKMWESIVQATKNKSFPYDQIDVQIVDESLLHSVCDGTRNNFESKEISKNQIDVWLCPKLEEKGSQQQSSTTWEFLHDGSIALHRKSAGQQVQDWQAIYPDASEALSHPLRHLVLTVIWESNQRQQQEDQDDDTVPLLLDRFQTWFPDDLLHASHYLWNSNVETNFVVHNLSDKARRIQHDHFDSEMNSTFTTFSYEMGIDDIVRGLDEMLDNDDNADVEPWRITLWIPSIEPMLLVDVAGEHGGNKTSSSHLLQVSNRHWFGLLHHRHQQQQEHIEKKTVEKILERLLARAIGIPEIVMESLVLDKTAWVNGRLLPTLYFKLWKQRRIRSLYRHAVTDLRSEYNRLSQSRRTVAITIDVAQAWSDIASNMEQAVRQGDKEWVAALQYLQFALQQLQALRQNPDLVEPLDLSIDHYAGIFVPLLVPLLIPMLLGVIRETKRYREKIKKKRVSGGKEKED